MYKSRWAGYNTDCQGCMCVTIYRPSKFGTHEVITAPDRALIEMKFCLGKKHGIPMQNNPSNTNSRVSFKVGGGYECPPPKLCTSKY